MADLHRRRREHHPAASDRRCDARANCEVERASFTWRDGLGRERTGEVVDVHLACQ